MRRNPDFVAFVRSFSAEMAGHRAPSDAAPPPVDFLRELQSLGAQVDEQRRTAVICAGAARVDPQPTLVMQFTERRRNQRELQLAFEAAVARQQSVCAAWRSELCLVHPDQTIEGWCVAWRREWDGAVVVSRRFYVCG